MISKSEKMIKSTQKKEIEKQVKKTRKAKLSLYFLIYVAFVSIFSPECNYENKKIGIIPNMCRLHKY